MDYITEVLGSTLVGHYSSRYRCFGGLRVATRRRIFRRNPDNTVNLNQPSITLDIGAVELHSAMTTLGTAVNHPSRRLIVHLPRPYDEARELYETLVPEVDAARFGQMANWQATLELAEINAPQGFMRYYRSDVTAAMAGSPSFGRQRST
jgi:hypothetical protein